MDINVQIAGTDYVVAGRTFEIYTQGCLVRCPGCHNQETWSFNGGKKFPIDDLISKFEKYDIMIKRFWILGGEPMQQDFIELEKMFRFLKSFNKEIWLFTSYDIYQIYPAIRDLCDYIKTGIYDTSSGTGVEMYGVKLATNNQKIWKREGNVWI